MNALRNLKKGAIERLTYMSGPGVALVFGSAFCLFVMVLFLGANAAWSSEVSGTAERLPISKISPVRADACPLTLTSAHDESSRPVLDRTRRSAGKAAALGLVLGVRYALQPAAQTGVAGSLSRNSALAIAQWRHCQKQQALRDVNSAMRWGSLER